jgi:hypothetical protein
MLSSFRNRRKDNKKISLITAALRRVHSPPSPSSFASPESLPIQPNRPPKGRKSGTPLYLLQSAPQTRHSSPQVHLDFSNDSNDWFPPCLLDNKPGLRESAASGSDHRQDNDHFDNDDVVLIGEPPEEDIISPEVCSCIPFQILVLISSQLPPIPSDTFSLRNPHSPSSSAVELLDPVSSAIITTSRRY